jgi:hypothetical protein
MEFRNPSRPSYRHHDHDAPVHRQAAPVPAPAEEPAAPPAKGNKSRAKNILRWWKPAVIILLVAGAGWLAYGYIHTKNELTKLKNPSAAGQNQTQQLIGKVGRLVDLPSGETPTLATVNDASKLKNQVFFADAQNGDKVLIYNHAGKAVLYRPSTNKIIEYSKVNLNG